MKVENIDRVLEIRDKIKEIDVAFQDGIHLFFMRSGYLDPQQLFNILYFVLNKQRFGEVVDFIKLKMKEEKEELQKELETL